MKRFQQRCRQSGKWNVGRLRVSKDADYRYIPRQRFAALPWYERESIMLLDVESGKADRLLGYGNACCSYGTGNDVIDGLMPGYFTRGLLTHQAVNPLCIHSAAQYIVIIKDIY